MLKQQSMSISSQEDSPARTSVSLDLAQGSQAIEADYGSKCCGSFASFDPDTSSWKMSQPFLFEEWGESSPTWPRAGILRNGTVYRLDTSMRRTNANVSSYLPTPTKSMGKGGWGISKSGRNRYSQAVISRAFLFGYKPPVSLLEWMMGFPLGFTDIASAEWVTLLRRSSQSGSGVKSSKQTKGMIGVPSSE